MRPGRPGWCRALPVAACTTRPSKAGRRFAPAAAGALAIFLGTALPAIAQPQAESGAPSIAIRPFVMGMQQRFAATQTFDAVFGATSFPFWGGGADVTFGSYFVELSASRFKQTGERVFHFDGQIFPLGIPLTATITPFEAIGGYRFLRWPRFIPYGGAGFGTYRYEEEAEFNARDEDVEARRAGLVLVGGIELRAHRWVAVGADVHYSRVTGIIGSDDVDSSLATELGEDDLGGVAARIKIIIGR